MTEPRFPSAKLAYAEPIVYAWIAAGRSTVSCVAQAFSAWRSARVIAL